MNRNDSNVSSQYSSMTSRFEDTVIRETDIILSTKLRDQVRFLLSQLIDSDNFRSAQFDMSNSNYFNKHYEPDTSILRMDSEFTNKPML